MCEKCKNGIIVKRDCPLTFCNCLDGQYKELISEKPKFDIMELYIYNEKFLIKIIKWQNKLIDFIKKYPKYKNGKK